MFDDRISDYFEGVAAKYLSAVDADPERSNGHEIGGLPAAGFREYLGTPAKNEEFRLRAKQVYIRDANETPVIADSHVTWYDARRRQSERSPEYRLYYQDSPVTACISEGDFFLVAKLRDGVRAPSSAESPAGAPGPVTGSLLMVFTPADSSIEHQLRAMFGLKEIGNTFKQGKLDAVSLLLPLRMMLEELGIDIEPPPQPDDQWHNKLLEAFGGADFPATAVFSEFARLSIADRCSPIEEPDATLTAWMEQEEYLFRIYERHIVQQRLKTGFGQNGEGVDAFISFSLSVQNRRKSRVGHAFEGHLDCLFRHHKLEFEQGRGKGKVTENNSRPDFIFPSFTAYHDMRFPTECLMMLGAKTTCKDRWRQVLSEADRIAAKHLITLEPAISKQQLTEMRSHGLQLVIPAPIHATYPPAESGFLSDIATFIRTVRKCQHK